MRRLDILKRTLRLCEKTIESQIENSDHFFVKSLFATKKNLIAWIKSEKRKKSCKQPG